MARCDLQQLVWLLRILMTRGGATLEDIADEMGVTVRTARRYVQKLRESSDVVVFGGCGGPVRVRWAEEQ